MKVMMGCRFSGSSRRLNLKRFSFRRFLRNLCSQIVLSKMGSVGCHQESKMCLSRPRKRIFAPRNLRMKLQNSSSKAPFSSEKKKTWSQAMNLVEESPLLWRMWCLPCLLWWNMCENKMQNQSFLIGSIFWKLQMFGFGMGSWNLCNYLR